MITMQSDVSSEDSVPGSNNHESTSMDPRRPQQSTTPPTTPPIVGACNVVSVTPSLGHNTLSPCHSSRSP